MTKFRGHPDRFLPEDPLFRLLVINGAIGTFVAGMLTVAVFVTDVARLGTLLLTTDMPVTAVALTFAGFVILFASTAMGVAVMMLPYGERKNGDDGRGGGTRAPVVGAGALLRPAVAPVPSGGPAAR